jgi:tetratricopeptide (TPR) repeat protein
MAQNDDAPLNGKQMKLLADGLLSAFDFDHLNMVVQVEAVLGSDQNGTLSVRRVLHLQEIALRLLDLAGIPRGQLRLQDSLCIREEERPAVRALVVRFRQLPVEEQRRLPALLNRLGKLQVGSGDFEEAGQSFTEAADRTPEAADRAETKYNAYLAALEDQNWDEALAAIKEAASLDPQRFAPFPLHRYEPRRILGAGGFGTAFLCLNRHLNEEVVVKTLHAADLARNARLRVAIEATLGKGVLAGHTSPEHETRVRQRRRRSPMMGVGTVLVVLFFLLALLAPLGLFVLLVLG